MAYNITRDERRKWSEINKIESEIEKTSRPSAADGYEGNIYGGFDRSDLTGKLLSIYEELDCLSMDPSAVFRHAGALFRARRLEEAKAKYTSLIKTSDPARLMLATLELCDGNRQRAAELVEEYNRICRGKNMDFMCTTLEKIELKNGQY